MPIHDWTKVDPGIFHAFALHWLIEIKRYLNRTFDQRVRYAILAPAFLHPSDPDYLDPGSDPDEAYIRRQQRLAIHAIPGDRVVATVEIPGAPLKRRPGWLRTFVLRLRGAIEIGVNCCVFDVFPPTSAARSGLHPLVWSHFERTDFPLHPGRQRSLMSYSAYPEPRAFVEPVAVGDRLPDMPLFLTPDEYVNVPLEATYEAAWAEVPDRWREVLQPPAAG